MSNDELLERTFAVMNERRCSFREARRILAGRGAAVRSRNLRRVSSAREREVGVNPSNR